MKKHKMAIRQAGSVLVLLILGMPAWSQSTNLPPWWILRGVADLQTPRDFAPVNQGQAKWMATKTASEFDAMLTPGGAGTNIATLIASFSPTNNHLPLNLGQLKALAKPFYDRLQSAGATNAYPAGMVAPYPWPAGTATNDFAMANLGQLKYVFSFNFDQDADGMADSWEMSWFLNLTQSASADYDDDGLANRVEFLLGFGQSTTFNPTVPCTNDAGNALTGLLVYTPME